MEKSARVPLAACPPVPSVVGAPQREQRPRVEDRFLTGAARKERAA